MKNLFAADIASLPIGRPVSALGCWLVARRRHGKILFLDLADSTGAVACVIESKEVEAPSWSAALNTPIESAVVVDGTVEGSSKERKLRLRSVELVSQPVRGQLPAPRRAQRQFLSSPKGLDNRHIYLRNPRFQEILRAKAELRRAFRNFLERSSFVEVDLPVLTMTTLYKSEEAFELNFFGTKAYLSQCASLYLAACTQALERVYTVAPAFRAAPSRSPRHNPEFWHIKGQGAWMSLKDMMDFVSMMVFETVRIFADAAAPSLSALGVSLDLDAIKPPYPTIEYTEAVVQLRKEGHAVTSGGSLGPAAERILMRGRTNPLFVVGLPASTEPFPYALREASSTTTRTADLLAPDGFGEILGIAEFETSAEAVRLRLDRAGRSESHVDWYLELLEQAPAPFSGFGLGIERVLRWLLRLPHVKETFAFPRLYRRLPYP